MSTDFSIKPVGAPAAISVAQPVSEAANNAVADCAAREPERHRGRRQRRACATICRLRAISCRIRPSSIAPPPRSSIRSSTARTNQVVEQFPDDATLRRRAYFHALDLTKDQPARPLATDRTA